jgi:4-amino-4-deoxy-L-arabinose transferase-like glycosyltransferase
MSSTMATAPPATAPAEPPARLGPRPISRVWEPLLVAVLVGLAAAVRWVDLWSVPIFTDEGDEIGLALRIARDGARPLTNDDPYLGPLFNYLLAGVFWLGGPNPWLPRLLMLALGALTVVPTYLLARDLALNAVADARRARIGGVIAVLLLAVNGVHVLVNSHVAWGACALPLLTTTATWLLVRAAGACHPERSEGSPSPGRLPLVLAGLVGGLAFQIHPLVAAFVAGAVVFVLWRARSWLRTPWPYVAAGVFLLAQLPTLLFMAREGPARWLAAVREKQTMYDGDQLLDGGSFVDRLGALLHTLGASLGGLLNDRDTPFPPLWHPAILLGAVLGIVALVWLWRRGQVLVPLLVIANIVLLPLVNGKYTPLISNGRYVMPAVVLVLAAIGAWGACSLSSVGRARWAPLVGVVALGVVSAASLVTFEAAAHRDGRTNDRLLASLAALEAAYRPGDAVIVDRAMYRDWSLTEGRLQRVFSSWLDMRGLSSRVVDVEEGGRVRSDLADRGGLAVLAQRTVPAVERTYRLTPLAEDAAPGAPAGSGYRVVRLQR